MSDSVEQMCRTSIEQMCRARSIAPPPRSTPPPHTHTSPRPAPPGEKYANEEHEEVQLDERTHSLGDERHHLLLLVRHRRRRQEQHGGVLKGRGGGGREYATINDKTITRYICNNVK